MNKIFTSHISIKNHINSHNSIVIIVTKINPLKMGKKSFEQTLNHKRDLDSKQALSRGSTSLFFRKMQIKTKMRFHYAYISMAKKWQYLVQTRTLSNRHTLLPGKQMVQSFALEHNLAVFIQCIRCIYVI